MVNRGDVALADLTAILGPILITILDPSSGNKDGFWANYWAFWSIFSGAVAAVLIFLWQIKLDNRKEAVNRYLDFQYDMFKNISTSLLQFDSSMNFSEKNLESKMHLAQELVTLLYMIEEGKKQLNEVVQNNDKLLEQDHRIGTFDELDKSLLDVLENPKNEELRNLVENNYPDLKRIIADKFEQRGKENSILNHWYLSEKSARSAKYLIGVSAVDKRILAIYDINDPESVKLDGVWVSFKPHKNPVLSVEEAQKGNHFVMEELTSWNARNPILYLKQYYTDSEGKSGLSTRTSNYLEDKLNDFETLGARDIIVVRTAGCD